MEAQYRILSQVLSFPSEKTLIIFQQVGKQEKIIQSVEQLANNKHLLNGFSPDDVALIKHIAEMES